MKYIAKYLQLFFAPWMAALMLVMISLSLSSNATAHLVDAEQLFGLDPRFMVKVFGILFIVGIVLMLISMMVDGFFLVRRKYGARIQQFVSPVIAPLSGKLLSIRHRMTDRQWQWTKVAAFLGLSVGLSLIWDAIYPPSEKVPTPSTVNSMHFPRAHVLLRMPVATPTEKSAWMKAKAEVKEFPRKIVAIPEIPMKTVTGPAVVRQIGPNTYEIHIAQRR